MSMTIGFAPAAGRSRGRRKKIPHNIKAGSTKRRLLANSFTNTEKRDGERRAGAGSFQCRA